MPIFIVIMLVASLIESTGLIQSLADLIGPAMAAFNLPIEASLPVLLASIRKDGLILFAEKDLATTLTAAQILTGVYIAGVLLPWQSDTGTIATWRGAFGWSFQVRSFT